MEMVSHWRFAVLPKKAGVCGVAKKAFYKKIVFILVFFTVAVTAVCSLSGLTNRLFLN